MSRTMAGVRFRIVPRLAAACLIAGSLALALLPYEAQLTLSRSRSLPLTTYCRPISSLAVESCRSSVARVTGAALLAVVGLGLAYYSLKGRDRRKRV